MDPLKKYKKLCDIIEELGSVAVAFSGGVDSTLLAVAANAVLSKDSYICLTVVIDATPIWDLDTVNQIVAETGINHEFIPISNIYDIKEFSNNDPQRCYFCKKAIIEELKKTATPYGITNIAMGTNTDDLSDFRPGEKAVKEGGVYSPLVDAGISKMDVREILQALGVSNWDKPSSACLASRIPYHEEVNPEKLKLIEKSECYLHNIGYLHCRVRLHGTLARLEFDSGDLERAFKDRDIIYKELSEYGIKYITIDLHGYSMGSMNKEIKG